MRKHLLYIAVLFSGLFFILSADYAKAAKCSLKAGAYTPSIQGGRVQAYGTAKTCGRGATMNVFLKEDIRGAIDESLVWATNEVPANRKEWPLIVKTKKWRGCKLVYTSTWVSRGDSLDHQDSKHVRLCF
jgi:hypothetical protein